MSTHEDRWWEHYDVLCFLARWMDHNDQFTKTDVVSMIQKPWKYTEEYRQAVREFEANGQAPLFGVRS